MAIKMTKVGVKPQEEKFEGRCSACGSEFECVRADLSHSADHRDPFVYIICTMCRGTVVMRERHTSKAVVITQFKNR